MLEPVQTLADALKERLKDRFWAALFVSFAIVNWRGIYILLFPSSDMGFMDRLHWVDGNLYDGAWITLVKTLLIPLGMASVSVALVPYLANVLEWIRYKAYVNRHNRQVELDKQVLEYRHELELSRRAQLKIEDEKRAMENKLREMEVKHVQAERDWKREIGEAAVKEREHVMRVIELLRKLDIDKKYFMFDERPKWREGDGNLVLLSKLGLIDRDGHSWYQLTLEGRKVLEHMSG